MTKHWATPRNVILVALLIAVLGRVAISYPLNDDMLQGSDFTAYMHIIWFSSQGTLDWDHSWYGGYSLLKYYPPLSYLFAVLIALASTPVIAYKAIIDIFFIAAPIAFYAFAKDFKMPKENTALSVLLFSFLPISVYYFWNGSYVTVVNTVFLILTWKCFKDYAETHGPRNLALAGLFFSLSMLIHQLTAVLNVMFVLAWIFLRYRKLCLKPLALGLLLSGFWLFPFILQYAGGESILRAEGAASVFDGIVYHLGLLPSLLAAGLIIAFFAFGVLRNKDNDIMPLFIVLALVGIVTVFSSYNRVLAILPIPFAILLSKMANERVSKIFAVLLLVVFIAIFYSFHPFFNLNTFEQWELPSVKDRVMYYPSPYDFRLPNETAVKFRYSAYLAPAAGQDIIGGWFHQSQMVRSLKDTKYPYINSVENAFNLDQNETHRLLSAGYVNTVVVNRFYPEYVAYFEKSVHFKRVGDTDKFIMFEVYPQADYIEINGKGADSDVSREINSIIINTECAQGNMTVKESYDDYWSASVNSNTVPIGITPEGFMSLPVGINGECAVKLSYSQPAAYYMFYAFSFGAFAFAVHSLFRKPD